MRCRTPIGWIRRFLSKLLIKHSSGLSVLAAPGKFPSTRPTNEAIDKLMTVARQEFDYVVVDVGRGWTCRIRRCSRMPRPSTW